MKLLSAISLGSVLLLLTACSSTKATPPPPPAPKPVTPWTHLHLDELRAIAAEERYELGLSLPLGLGWRLKGGHLRKTELPTGAVERRTELSLLKPVGGARRLRLGLSLAERFAGAGEIRSYEFMLGYVHEFTSTFGLSLEGRMRREAFGGMLSEPYYQAEMKFRLLY